jgi:hypothetical protein
MDVTTEEQIEMALDVWARWTLERRDAEGLSDEEQDLLAAWQEQQQEYGRFDSIEGVTPPGVALPRVNPDTDRCPRCEGVVVYDEEKEHLACEACGTLLREGGER